YRFSRAGRLLLFPQGNWNLPGKGRPFMASHFDLMNKINTPGGIPTSRAKQTERRSSRRCKITQLMRIRPSDPERDHFDDIRGTVSMSRTGVYFHSSETGYQVGMRLFVTMPYTKEPTSMQREYLAEVVR